MSVMLVQGCKINILVEVLDLMGVYCTGYMLDKKNNVHLKK